VKYFLGLHIKSLIILKLFGATFGIGGGKLDPLPPPGYAPDPGRPQWLMQELLKSPGCESLVWG